MGDHSLKYPVRIKDAQRIVTNSTTGLYRSEMDRIADALGVERPNLWYWRPYTGIQAELARRAARDGANSVLLASPEPESSPTDAQREHRIGTDEVAPQSEHPSEDADMHGGDSVSGEVESGTSQGGENKSGATSGTTAQALTGAGTGGGLMGQGAGQGPRTAARSAVVPQATEAGEQSPGDAATETGNATSDGAHTRSNAGRNNAGSHDADDAQGERESTPGTSDNPESETAVAQGGLNDHGAERANTPPSADDEQHAATPDPSLNAVTGRPNRSSLDALPADDGETRDARPDAPAKESGESGVVTTSEKVVGYHYRSVKSGSQGGQSSYGKSKKSDGGITADLRAAGIDRQVVKKARVALARLLNGGEDQSGPRWDWVEFSKRLKTARSVYPARKEEEGRPAILLLADVSGSCSGFSDVSLKVARSVAQLGISGTDVIVVSHSNGFPESLLINGSEAQDIPHEWQEWEEWLVWYAEQLQRFDIRAVVALGDWDAAWLYSRLTHSHRVTRFVWLDNCE